ncbi:uhpC [Scenedesmus sp. PABB004]|nr:uhpC [Scenedesmus sp. PABB004]
MMEAEALPPLGGLAIGAPAEDGGIASEIRARHGHSAQPESQRVLAALQAVLEVIAGQGMAPTPTAIFAALMAALDRPDAQASPETSLAMCTILGTALSRVPTGVLRAKFVGSVQLLCRVVGAQRGAAPAAKASLLCLGQVLAAAEPGAWHAAAPGWQLLLGFLTDARPKVRRRALASMSDVLAALQGSPASLAPASEAVVALCKLVLPGPAAAARAAAAASNKQRAAAEAAITSAVADVLHLLAALKSAAPLLAGASLPPLADLLVKLYGLRQPLLSRHTSDVLAALAGAPGSHLSAAQLGQLLRLLVDGEAAALLAAGLGGGGGGGGAGGDQLSAMARLLEAGLMRLAELAPEAAAKLLPKVVHLLVPLLAAEQDGVRYSASGALRSLIGAVLTPALVAAMQAAPARGGAPPLASLVAAVAGGLGARYQEAWGLALPAAAALCEALAAGGAAALAAPLLAALGEICAGLADEAEQRDAGAMDLDGEPPAGPAASAGYASAAEAALGAAIRALGPAAVLEALPLQLQEGLAGGGEARTWLLPALRRHVRGAPLGFWSAQLLPLARQMGAAAGAASGGGRKGLAAACHALELQLWGSLQAFASWPTDAPEVYPGLAPELAAAFHTREDLRGIICAVLVRLCRQARGVAAAALTPGGPRASEDTLAAIRGLGLASSAAAAVPGAGRGGEHADGDDDDDDAPGGAAGGDSDDEDGYAPSAGPGGADAPRGRRGGDAGGDAAGPDTPASAPPGFTPAAALAQLVALRGFSGQWLRLMCKIFIEAGPEGRGHVGEAIAAYASVSEAGALAGLFRIALGKYGKIGRDAAAEVPPPDVISEGGSTPEERQAAFLELALCLAGGLPDAALDPLFAACRAHVLGGASLLQKRSYRVLAYLAASRPAWLVAHLAAVLELLLLGSAAALSPAKRYRLRCLRPLILLLDSTPCPPLPGLVDAASGAEAVPGGAALARGGGDGADADARRGALAQLLVGELVLATKEANKKTRTAAYALLVDIAHELDDARPLSLAPHGGAGSDSDSGGGGSDSMSDGGDEYGAKPSARARRFAASARGRPAAASGGLLDFVHAVMAGLAGASPHMQSAAVLALARLVFEFAGALEGLVGRLLPAVLLLLRSQSREVVKAVLGFIKVCAMRMPVDMLLVWLPQLLEGMLIWADDSKNKFRLKIRVIVERLVRRCGLDAVAAACPPGDAKLIAHIRKQNTRKDRRRDGGSQADAAEFDRRSARSGAARSVAGRTARASEWGHTAIFSDDGDGVEGGSADARSLGGRPGGRGGGRAGSVAGGRSVGGRTAAAGGGGRGGPRLADGGEAGDPQDLLEAGTARQLVRSAAAPRPGPRAGAGAAPFPRGEDGRLVIAEPRDDEAAKREEAELFGWSKRPKGLAAKRRRGEFGEDDGDSDLDDMRGFAGLAAAVRGVEGAKSVRFAPSIAASLGNRSLGAKTARSGGGRSAGAGARSVGGASARSGASARGGRGAQHSGERYASKSGAAGDVKKGAVEPYAYWAMDRKLLNRRRGKQAAASKGIAGVVAGAAAGAAKGAKAKRAADTKRARRAPAPPEQRVLDISPSTAARAGPRRAPTTQQQRPAMLAARAPGAALGLGRRPPAQPAAAPGGGEGASAPPPGFVTRRLLVFVGIVLGYTTFYLTRGSLTYSAPAMVADPSLGFTLGHIGAMTSIFPMAYGVSKFAAGVLSTAVSSRLLLGLGLIATAGVNLAFGASSTMAAFCALWGLNGMLQGVGAPACATVLTRWFAAKERGTYWGMWNIAHNLGGFLAPVIVGGCAKAFGWRWGMWAPGLIGVGVGLAVLAAVRDKPADLGFPPVDAPAAAAAKPAPAAAAPAPPAAPAAAEAPAPAAPAAAGGGMMAALSSVMRLPAIWALALTYFFIYVVRQGCTSWLVFYLMAEKGAADAGAAALTVSGLELGGLAGSTVAGMLSDRAIRRAGPGAGLVGKRVQVVMAYTLAMAGALVALQAVPPGARALQWLAIAALGFSIYGPQMLIGLSGAELVSPVAVGASQGVLGWIAYLGAANAGIPLAWVVQTHGWGGFFAALLGACGVALALLATVANAQSFGQREAKAVPA